VPVAVEPFELGEARQRGRIVADVGIRTVCTLSQCRQLFVDAVPHAIHSAMPRGRTGDRRQ
jgi:hypothetical protein